MINIQFKFNYRSIRVESHKKKKKYNLNIKENIFNNKKV